MNPPMDQAYITMSLSWKPSLCSANWITASMALASFWGNGTPWKVQKQKLKHYSCICKQRQFKQQVILSLMAVPFWKKIVPDSNQSFHILFIWWNWSAQHAVHTLQTYSNSASTEILKSANTAYRAASKARVIPAQYRVATYRVHQHNTEL